MSSHRRHLRLVHDDDDVSDIQGAPPVPVTDSLLDHLRAVTDLVHGGGGFCTPAQVAVKPPHGLIVVLVDEDGRPTPMGALHGVAEQQTALRAAATALQMIAAGQTHDAVHRSFDRTAAMRAEQRARTEEALPFVCSCGKRTATRKGLDQHQGKCPGPDRQRQEMP